jgi:peptidoglycan/xylan/chitin deacetylase (PgdA/CDA1 family)
MAWLKAWGWQTLPLSQAFEAVRGPRRRRVVLTFDDGFANFYHEVFPILREFGMTAAVFVVTDYVGGRAEWLARDREVTEALVGSLPLDPAERALWVERLLGLATEPLLTWPQIQELAVAGIEFHAHTASHPLLSRLSPGEVEQEIRRCQHALAAALGPQPRFFAYPYGVPTPMARTTLTAMGCPGALLAIPPARIWGGAHDAMAIPRVGIPGTASPNDFRFRLSRALALASRSWQVGGEGMHRG